MIAASICRAIGRSPARFDFAKLESLNGHYIRAMRRRRSGRRARAAAAAYRRRRRLAAQADAGAARQVHRRHAGPEGARQDPGRAVRGRALSLGRAGRCRSTRRPRRMLTPEAAGADRRAAAGAAKPYPMERRGRPRPRCAPLPSAPALKLGAVAQPLRAALTGRTTSPAIFDVLAVLGKTKAWRALRDQIGAERPARADCWRACLYASARRWLRYLAAHTWMSYPNDSRNSLLHAACRLAGPHRSTAQSEGSTMDAKTDAKQDRHAHRRQQELGLPGLRGHRSARTSSTSPSSTAQTGDVHLRSRLHLDGELRVQDHLYRRRRRHPALSRLSDRAARRARRLPRDLLPAALRRTADARRRRPISTTA